MISKALFQKRRFFVPWLAALTMVGVLMAPTAQAGFLSGILRLIAGQADADTTGSSSASISMPLLGSAPGFSFSAGIGGPGEENSPALVVTQDSALVGNRNPAGTLPSSSRDQIVAYTVQPGDTPSSIAGRFGISLNTLLWANNIRNPNVIKMGDELVILPVSGVQYEVKKGDTIESIAKRFRGDPNEILGFNGLAVNESLVPGTTIIIPDGEIATTPATAPGRAPSRFENLPDLVGYFLRPISGGRRTRGIHGYNGVDLANSCGLPVFTSAPGSVLLARLSGWNGGYGNYVAITHPTGVQTLYAHLSQVLVNPGQSVSQGEVIGLIGSTGNSTGCHVHFEVRGAKNPF